MSNYPLRFTILAGRLVHAAYLPGNGAFYPSTACGLTIVSSDVQMPNDAEVTCSACRKKMQ